MAQIPYLSHCRVATIPNSEAQQLLGWSGYFGAISRENFDSLGSQFNLLQNCYNLVGEYPWNTKHLSCFKTSHSLINNSCISCMILFLFCCCRSSQLGNRGSKSKLTYSQFPWHHWWKCLWCSWWSKRHQKKKHVGLCCISVCNRRKEHGQPMFANWEEQSLEGDCATDPKCTAVHGDEEMSI